MRLFPFYFTAHPELIDSTHRVTRQNDEASLTASNNMVPKSANKASAKPDSLPVVDTEAPKIPSMKKAKKSATEKKVNTETENVTGSTNNRERKDTKEVPSNQIEEKSVGEVTGEKVLKRVKRKYIKLVEKSNVDAETTDDAYTTSFRHRNLMSLPDLELEFTFSEPEEEFQFAENVNLHEIVKKSAPNNLVEASESVTDERNSHHEAKKNNKFLRDTRINAERFIDEEKKVVKKDLSVVKKDLADDREPIDETDALKKESTRSIKDPNEMKSRPRERDVRANADGLTSKKVTRQVPQQISTGIHDQLNGQNNQMRGQMARNMNVRSEYDQTSPKYDQTQSVYRASPTPEGRLFEELHSSFGDPGPISMGECELYKFLLSFSFVHRVISDALN